MIKPNTFLAKVDIKSAYSHIPLHPLSQRATGLQWTFENCNKQYMYDTKLYFGARMAPMTFHRISVEIKRIMERKGHKHIVAYHEDFLLIGEIMSSVSSPGWRS